MISTLSTALTAAAVVHGATWTTQSPTIPQFDWVVVDHADGNSMGYGVTVANGHAFVSGSMRSTVRVENPANGQALESRDEGSDGDIFLAKVSLDGNPAAIWTYAGSSTEFPAHLATSHDEAYISMTGYFSGNVSFDEYTFTNTKDPATRDRDGFAVKVASADGAIEWARHFPSDAGTTCSGTAFDSSGNIVVVGRRCTLIFQGESCAGFVALLAAEDGSTVWEHQYGTAIQTLVDVAVADDKYYMVGQLLGTTNVDSVEITSASSDADAVLVVLDSSGKGLWGATISGDGLSSSSLIEVIDGSVYMNCLGSCLTISSTVSTTTATMEGLLNGGVGGGGVAKISTAGEPIWGADVPYSLGMGVTNTSVYVNYYATGSQTYGDTTFTVWGGWDHYIVKLNGETGAGEWVLQTGGHGLEYVRRMAVDSAGDLYSVGLTWSQPAYFDPLTIDSHNDTDGYDLFLAKLTTSEEKLPPCKTTAASVASGSCFINNVCYDAGETSRARFSTCWTCSPADSQTSFTMAEGHCFIDGACYAHGESGSECQVCNVSVSTDSWTLVPDEYTLAADGSCVALTTWTTQSAMIPEFEWVIIDHGNGNTIGAGATVTSDAVYVSGSTTNTLIATNYQTGESITSSDAGGEVYLYISKASLDGTPELIWTYETADSLYSAATHVAASSDGTFLAMVGGFTGSVTLGDQTFVNNPGDGLALYDKFVAKVSTSTGEVAWARHFEGVAGVGGAGMFYGVTAAFDSNGDIAFTGARCTEDGTTCAGYVLLLNADDGSTMWELNTADNGFEPFVGIDFADDKFYLSGSIVGTATLDDVVVSSASPDYSDALLLVLDSQGRALWAATISGDASSTSLISKVFDDAIYMTCSGDCREVRTTASQESIVFEAISQDSVVFQGTLSGGVTKINTNGVPLWTADLPLNPWTVGLAITSSAVYVESYNGGAQYGDTTFTAWGGWDVFIAKINSVTGHGEWVLQSGSQGSDGVFSTLGVDGNGDVYSFGGVFANPAYFDPLQVDTHSSSDGYDLFVAKLLTSEEKLPSCKSDEATVAAGFCFINNVCYEDGAPSRALSTASCLACSPSNSQTSFTIAAGYCVVDGMCYADGTSRALSRGKASACEYCDVSASTDTWSVRTGYSLTEDGMCARAPGNPTWTTQSATLPGYDWVVIDHGDGETLGAGAVIMTDKIFVAGSTTNSATLTNPQTGASISSESAGGDANIYVTKVSLDGTPETIWTYSGYGFDIGTHLAAAPDEVSLAMAGGFMGNLTLGDYTIINEQGDSPTAWDWDKFVAKVSPVDGEVAWARHFPRAGPDGNNFYGASTVFDSDGNVAFTGTRCVFSGGVDTCTGFVALLDGDDGSTIWELDFGGTGLGPFVSVDFADGKLYLSGATIGTNTVDDLTIVSSSAEYTDALLLVIESTTGRASWAATISGGKGAWSALTKVKDDTVYMTCNGGCVEVWSTASETMVSFEGIHNGGVTKLGTDGEAKWAADLPLLGNIEAGHVGVGIAVTSDALYLDYHVAGSLTYGDTTFTSWGDWDVHTVKIDPMSGKGEWVLQSGSPGREGIFFDLGIDSNGDIYSFGTTFGHPLYVDPLLVDSHTMADGYDFYIAKLETSVESLPSCKTDETTIVDGYCFVNNVCYEDGAPSRFVATQSCMRCSASDTQTSFTPVEGYCIIDSVCYADDAPRSLSTGIDSSCQYCDASASTEAWTIQSGAYSIDADGSCVARNATWMTQSPMLPEYEWVVVDQGDGFSWSHGVTITEDAVYVTGVNSHTVQVTNAQTRESIASSFTGADYDVHLTKVSLDGTPQSIWVFPGSEDSTVYGIASSLDGSALAMVGAFLGNVTFGEYVLDTTFKNDRTKMEGYVVKLSATSGEVAWAQQVGLLQVSGAAFDARGNVVVSGGICEQLEIDLASNCDGVVKLLSAKDGSSIWEKDFRGTGIYSLLGVAHDNYMIYTVGHITGTATIDDLTVSSATTDYSDALLIALNAADGKAVWVATISGQAAALSSVAKIVGNSIYMDCYGSCHQLRTTASHITLTFEALYSGGIAKIGMDGTPMWAADVDLTDTGRNAGIAATADAVYVQYMAWGSGTYGDLTLTDWGSGGIFIGKLNAETGAAEWLLQSGGPSHDRAWLNSLEVDANGDIYSVGVTLSPVLYFDPLVVDIHSNLDGGDLFIAKLQTTNEALPPCKIDETTIAEDSCFVSNVCYADGAASRGATTAACLKCSTSDSQTSLTQADGYCLIDGVCYADGDLGSVCQYCDVSRSKHAWTLRSDKYTLAADGSCVAMKTWTEQSAMLPEFEWVVLDHGVGESFAFFHTLAEDGLFVSGRAGSNVTLRNPETGGTIESTDMGDGTGMYIAKVSLDGEPLSIWTYKSSITEYPLDMAYSDGNLALSGLFTGEITFGETTLTTIGAQQVLGFVVKLSAVDGVVKWAKTIPSSGSSTAYRPPFNEEGHIAVSGDRCDSGGDCAAYVTLLDREDGSTLWFRDFGTAIPRFAGLALHDTKFYLAGRLEADVVVDGLSLSPKSDADGILLVLEASGTAEWAVIISGDEGSFSRSIEVAVVDSAIYMMCFGGCREIRSTQTSETVEFEDNTYNGGIAKISIDGLPVWAAELPTGWSIAANNDAVYMNFPASSSLTFGDTTFMDWGGGDVYVAKIDAITGAGEWILQTGGQGRDVFACSVELDPQSGDLYHVGKTLSFPAYFDPLVVDSHAADGGDLFIAKLATSNEKLPSCKNDATTVADGYCFISNACYPNGAKSRSLATEACMICSSADSQTSFTRVAGSCFIDGECYADGTARSIGDGVDSQCQYCDVSGSTDTWSVRTGFTLAEDGTSCEEETETRDEDEDPTSKIIAGYLPATNVSSHAKMDLDAHEIAEFAGQSDFGGALFVYENGGNGLCSEQDIENAGATDSCFGKSVDDAKGNSISSSGSIRTIKAFALAGPSKMAGHKWYPIYRDYWGDVSYSDSFVQNALSASGVWSMRSDAMRAELATKGAVYHAVWMYMLHEMEEAIVQCEAGNTFKSDTSTSAPHRWDEFWAFYAGSLEGPDGSGDGEFLWALAEKRCAQFATCDARGRTARANEMALQLALSGLENILAGDCASAQIALDAIVSASTVPLVQGLLKYVYDADPTVNRGSCTAGVCTYDEAWGEGWAFAAAVLPRINECDPTVAQIVRENLDVDNAAGAPMKDGYHKVKALIESTYPCLGITCADIGAYQSFDGVYEGMEACQDVAPFVPSSKKTKKTRVDHSAVIALTVVLAIIVVAVIALCIAVVLTSKRTIKDSTHRQVKTKNTLVSEIQDDASETTASDITHLDLEE